MIGEMLHQEAVLEAVDFPLFYKGANLIALAVDHLRAEIDSLPAAERSRLRSARFEFACPTPLGWVRLNGAGDHRYGPEELLPGSPLRPESDDEHDLLILDTAGNDTYSQAGATTSARRGIGVAVDLAGDDRYASPDAVGWQAYNARVDGRSEAFVHHRPEDHVAAFGAGILGYGFLIDLAGDDRYYCNDSAFGVGNVNGLGVFWDKAGDDLYIARSNSFGQPFVESSGSRRDFIINAGLFIDAGGEDDYRQLPEDFDAAAHEPFDFGDGSQFTRIEWLGDGTRRSWRGHLEQPLSTGAAVDMD